MKQLTLARERAIEVLAEDLYSKRYGNVNEGRAQWKRMKQGRAQWLAEAERIIERLENEALA